MIKNGEASLPDGGKTFFPQFTNGDEGLKEWLSGDGGANKGVVDDIIFNPDRVEPNGRWGTVLYKKVTLPDEAIVPKDFKPNSGSRTVELAVYIGKARTIPEAQLRPGQLQPTFKINSVFPVQGDGVTEVLADGTIANRGFPLKDLGDGNG
jgi:RHS repeat-associated core domain protein